VPLAAGCGGPAEPDVVDPREVLLLLYEQADGPNWKRNDNWGTEAPVDEWYGVETDAQGNVTELILPANGLAGTIPPELGRLKSLDRLLLGANELTGSIPPELGNLQSLTVLWLATNELTGPIPAELGNLGGLDLLELSDNELTGRLPPTFGGLEALGLLSVFANSLNGALPLELTRTRIREFVWYDTDLCAPLDEDFQAWLRSIPYHSPGENCTP